MRDRFDESMIRVIFALDMHRFDKTHSESFKAEDRKNDYAYWSKKTCRQRLEAAYYLNSVAYNFDPNDPPRMDKTIFSARKRD